MLVCRAQQGRASAVEEGKGAEREGRSRRGGGATGEGGRGRKGQGVRVDRSRKSFRRISILLL